MMMLLAMLLPMMMLPTMMMKQVLKMAAPLRKRGLESIRA
jgi:hypothetical protein